MKRRPTPIEFCKAESLDFYSVLVDCWDASEPKKPIFYARKMICRAVHEAFEAANMPQDDLDNVEAEDWLLLASLLAFAIFGRKGAGAPPSWTPWKIDQLQKDVATIIERDPSKTELAACTELIDRFSSKRRAKKPTAKALLKQLQIARNPVGKRSKQPTEKK